MKSKLISFLSIVVLCIGFVVSSGAVAEQAISPDSQFETAYADEAADEAMGAMCTVLANPKGGTFTTHVIALRTADKRIRRLQL